MRYVLLPGDLIRHYRIKAGLTQEALGILAGFSKSTAGTRIAQYETGARNTKVANASKIAAALNLSMEKLISSAENDRRLIAIGLIAEEYFDCDGITSRQFAAMLRKRAYEETGGTHGF